MAAPRIAITPLSSIPTTTQHTMLLACGIAAPLLYGSMLVFVPMGWEEYSSASQTISELSAIGAPTRSLWFSLGLVYTLFVAAFGWGIWMSADRNRRLAVAGALLVASGVFGLFWPPMHLRGEPATLTDTLHIVWMAVSGLLTMVAMGFAAAALGNRFRVYSIISIVLMLAAGALTSVHASNIPANLPTPWMGVWERIGAGVWMLWFFVLAVALLRRLALGPPAPQLRSGGQGVRP
jgi:hypothetical protein